MGEVAKKVIGKKSFFEEQQPLLIAFSRMPKDTFTIVNAVNKMMTKDFSSDNLGTLLRKWPEKDVMDGLVEEYEKEENKGAQWEKAEQFYYELSKENGFKERLMLWEYMMKFDNQFEALNDG